MIQNKASQISRRNKRMKDKLLSEKTDMIPPVYRYPREKARSAGKIDGSDRKKQEPTESPGIFGKTLDRNRGRGYIIFQ